jgi:hypothetical protein
MPSIAEESVQGQARQYVWSFDTALDWTPYCDWVAQRLSGQLRVRRRDDAAITLSGLDNGDAYYLDIRRIDGEAGALRLRATLRMTPD